jgi:hypothetical protein
MRFTVQRMSKQKGIPKWLLYLAQFQSSTPTVGTWTQIMFDIRVMEGDQIIGHMTPDEFRRSTKPSSHEFLSDTVAKFNSARKDQGDPTHVKIVFKKA